LNVALTKLAANRKYFDGDKVVPTYATTPWFTRVHAANLLSDLLKDVSENTHEFRKTTDTVAIFEWINLNRISHLEPLIKELTQALKM
jgi:hypothetical protein